MIKVFVSGCFDGLIHGGHIEFFKQAKALGDILIVSFASDKSLLIHKNRKPSLPTEHKIKLLESLYMIDKVMVSNDDVEGLDFKSNFIKEKPDMLVVTEDDKYEELKRNLCNQVGAKYIKLPKTLAYEKISTTEIINNIKAPIELPMRVDLCGAWLDLPEKAVNGGYIINCTITPMVSLNNWKYQIGSGLGGSAVYSMLCGKNGIKSELEENGVGWQDPACIMETGLCVWKSGKLPVLDFKTDPDWLSGRMALLWTGKTHKTNEIKNIDRDYNAIVNASIITREAVCPNNRNFVLLSHGVNDYYNVQLNEGMKPLPTYNEFCKKYLGSGHGGYALYLFKSSSDREEFLKNENTMAIEPYIRGC